MQQQSYINHTDVGKFENIRTTVLKGQFDYGEQYVVISNGSDVDTNPIIKKQICV